MAHFDLNLLDALNALLSDRNVTRAAERLNVSQPTMSGMLQRLRHQFDDQLLVRNGRELVLTPFAESLVEPARDALRSVEQLIHAEPAFEPATSTRTFTIMMSDYCAFVFLPHLVAHVNARAPHVRVVAKALDDPVERVFAGDVDLCLAADSVSFAGEADPGGKINLEPLFSDEFVCVVANEHPCGGHSTLEELFQFPHVSAQLFCSPDVVEPAWTERRLPSYKPQCVVAEFSLIPHVVAYSAMVGFIQARMAAIAVRMLPVRTFTPPLTISPVRESMSWHSRRDDDPALRWLRAAIRATVASTLTAPPR